MYSLDLSILCLTYNHVLFIEEAIDSFLSQKTNFTYEIIVCDDASTDGTGDLLKSKYLNNSKVRIFNHSKNKGVLGNGLFALSKCTGRYIMCCEGDDFWVSEDKVEIQLQFLEDNPSYFGVHSSAIVINEVGDYVKTVPLRGKDFDSVGSFFRSPYWMPTCTVTFRNELRGNLFTYRELLRSTKYITDYLLDAVICSHGRYKFIDEPLGCYRVTKNTDSFSSQSIQKMEGEMLFTRDKLKKYFNGQHEFSIFISKSFVFLSVVVKYSKISINDGVKRFLRIPFRYKPFVLFIGLWYFGLRIRRYLFK